jgi:hypothetical protein
LIIGKLRETLFSPELVLKFRMKEQDFTRERKQPFTAALMLMFNFLRKSLTIEIDGFLSYIKGGLGLGKDYGFTSSAFIQNRKKINPAVFSHLSGVIVDNFYTKDNDGLKLWNGFRVLAVDGSRITLPNTCELKESFGVAKNQSEVEVVQARASILYDVLNRIVLDATLGKMEQGEQELALTHTHRWQEKDLVIYDRGYPSYDLMHGHISAKTDCLIRVKTSYGFSAVSSFVASGKKTLITELSPNQNRSFKDKSYGKDSKIRVRLVRVELSNGEVEVLLTTLLDSKKYPSKMFGELYFLRWKIETFYDELKNKLKVENFTGYSQNSIRQDFLCAIFISNLQSIMVNDMQNELAEQNNEKKYSYKVNTNLSYGLMKNRILDLLGQKRSLEQVFLELQELFLKHTVPIRNNRTNKRNTGKFRARTKPKITKNQKDSI